MKKQLGTYRGANIYETKTIENAGDKLLTFKIWATGIHPHPKNLKVDFIQEGRQRHKAFSMLIKKIDQYLEEHNIDEFEREGDSA